MKKRFAILLTIIMMMSVITACSTKGTEKLVVAARGGTHVTAMEAVKEKFEKEHNVEVEIIGLESADLKQKISLDSANKKGAYDLIMADDPWMPEFSEAGIFANLTESGLTVDSDFEDSSLALGKYPYDTGNLYALPFSGNVQLFFYNKHLLESYNYEAPQSWADVLTIAQDIHTTDKNVAGYVIRGQQGNPIVSDFLPIFWAYGGQVFDENWKAQLNTDAGKQALETYIQLLEVGANYETTDIVSSVSEGRGAMALGWPSWFIVGEEAKADYAAIPAKADNNTEVSSTGMIGNWMMGVTANSKNTDLAVEFLTYITSSEVQKQMVEHGGVPTRKSVYQDAELVAKYKHFPTLLEALQNSVARPRTAKWSRVEEALGIELTAAIAGIKSVEDALSKANEAIDLIMQ